MERTLTLDIGASELRDRFAEAHDDPVERWISVAGLPVRLVFANPVLVPLVVPAFAHIERAPATRAALTIHLWDSVSIGMASPPLPFSPDDPPGTFYVIERPPFHAVARPGQGYLSAYESTTMEAWHWIDDPENVRFGDVAGPLRAILHWFAIDQNLQLVHGGAVATDDAGILLVGKGGSGKSTTTLACLNAGMRFAGDDHVLVAPGQPPHVHSLYNSCKLHPHHLERFPELMPSVWNAERLDREKAVGFVHQHQPTRTSAGFPLVAVVVPRVTGASNSRSQVLGRRAGLAALAPSTIFQLAGSRGSSLSAMADIVRSVPCYSLECGTNLDGVAAAVRTLIDEVGGR